MDFLYNFWSFEKVYSSTIDCATLYGVRITHKINARVNFHRPPPQPEAQITVFRYIIIAIIFINRTKMHTHDGTTLSDFEML